MMRIGLVSDSHGSREALERALKALGSCDLIIHAGDYASDADFICEQVGVPVMVVRGNCDFYDERYPDFIDTKLGGHHFFITHGNRQYVKMDLDDLLIEAKAREADIAVFGHTHIPTIQEEDGVLMVNPGSVYLPHSGQYPTCAVLTLDGGKRSAEIIQLGAKKGIY